VGRELLSREVSEHRNMQLFHSPLWSGTHTDTHTHTHAHTHTHTHTHTYTYTYTHKHTYLPCPWAAGQGGPVRTTTECFENNVFPLRFKMFHIHSTTF